jgi:twitching motility protein PilT
MTSTYQEQRTRGSILMKLGDILKTAFDHKASDIHLIAGHPPMMRVNTVMTPMDYPILTPASVKAYLEEMVTPPQIKRFEENQDLDFSYAIKELGRYRVNAHMQRNSIGLAMRAIKSKVPPLEALNLPEVISRLTYLPRGLVLVTGDTGSGKSTTLAAMIEAMNQRYRKHIITLEDPVEYSFSSNKCVIEQRELGMDMPTFLQRIEARLASGPRHRAGRRNARSRDHGPGDFRRRNRPLGAFNSAHRERFPDGRAHC